MTNLSHLDRVLITTAVHHPEASYATWADHIGISARTVARRFEALQRRGVVRIIGRTLPNFGGQLAWLIRIHASPHKLSGLASKLEASPSTRWLRYSVDKGELLCGSVTVSAQYEKLLLSFHTVAPARDINVHQLLHVWGNQDSVVTGAEEIDDIDRHLLKVYATDGRLSASTIAKDLGVNSATVSRHKRRLIDAGILYFEAVVHPGVFSTFGDFNLWFTVQPGAIRQVGEALRSMPQTRFVAATSGTSQIYANIIVPGPDDVMPLLDELGEQCGSAITAIETVPMGTSVKKFS